MGEWRVSVMWNKWPKSNLTLWQSLNLETAVNESWANTMTELDINLLTEAFPMLVGEL